MKKEFRFYLSLFITIIIVTLVLLLISRNKDVLDIETINKLFYSSNDFLAEKNEKLMYITSLVLVPSVFILIYSTINKFKIDKMKIIESIYGNIFITAIFAFLIYYLLLTDNIYKQYIQNIFYDSSVFIFLFIFHLYFFLFKRKIKDNKLFNKILIITSICFLLLTTSIFIKTNFFFTYFETTHHFEAFYYPAYYVYHNLDIGIDFTNLYGLYPYYLLPIFKLLGGITVLKFTIIYALILLFVSILLLIFLFKYLKNKFISFLAFLSILMYYINQLLVFKAGYYYQYIPHRIIFPIIIFFIIYKILTTTGKKQNRFKILGYIISGMSLLYNIDSGVVTIITYLGFNIYQSALDYNFKDKKFYIESFKNIGYTILSCLFFIILFKLIIYFRTGDNLKLTNILYGQTVFYKLGFYMLKMKLIHPWIVLIFVYFYSLTYSITKLKCFNKKITKEYRIKYSLIFTLALIGLGIFSYFQGRSHRNVFLLIIWPIIIIIAIILDNMKLNNKKYYKYNYYLREILIVSFFTFFSSIFSHSIIFNKDLNKFYQINPTEKSILYNVDFVESKYNTLKEKYHKVNLILDYTSQYYAYLNITNFPKLDNPIDWLNNKEKIDTTINYILEHKNEAYIISKRNYTYINNNVELMEKVKSSFNVDANRKNIFIILTPLDN